MVKFHCGAGAAPGARPAQTGGQGPSQMKIAQAFGRFVIVRRDPRWVGRWSPIYLSNGARPDGSRGDGSEWTGSFNRTASFATTTEAQTALDAARGRLAGTELRIDGQLAFRCRPVPQPTDSRPIIQR